MSSDSIGSTYFNMLAARMEKRFSHGFQFLVNYSFSKMLERLSRLNASDLVLEKRIAPEDRTQRLVLSFNWELPFGKGRWLGSGAGPVVNQVIGGWTVNSVYTVQSGAPLGWGDVIYYGGDLHLDPRAVNGSFDVTRFNRNSQEQRASDVRTFPTMFGNLRQDGVNNLDFSVIKNFPIREAVKLQFRCELFNALNHAEFNAPSLSPTSSGFGLITSQANLARTIQMALRMTW